MKNKSLTFDFHGKKILIERLFIFNFYLTFAGKTESRELLQLEIHKLNKSISAKHHILLN